MNPYKVLGVSEDATQEEIRAAYLALVKKYHPDKYSDNPLKELANEKIKEINEAYEILTKRGNTASSSGRGSDPRSSYGGAYSGTGSAYSGPSAAEFARARSFINSNNLQAAKQVLDTISVRNAEWYYLYGIIYLRQGWYDKAREYLSRAYEQEPGNPEYRNAYAAVNNAGTPYGRNTSGTGQNYNCSCCDICGALMCADCCCSAMRC
ncbi:J domain-containing protein [Christensenellaceae bacterium OttesenSCG-928-M15]|nr:J domain-containing protein [Christensenellaceae bacterium OttesenSCG-928-M15]